MKLYLVQHGKAVSKDVDPERPLSEEGRREVQKIVEFIKPVALSVGYLWHSPKKRAVQTAELISKAIKVENSIISRDDIGPNDDVSRIEDETIFLEHDVMLVGHLPFLSKLASELLTANESANTVSFKNSGIVCLERSESSHWQVGWIVTPELVG